MLPRDELTKRVRDYLNQRRAVGGVGTAEGQEMLTAGLEAQGKTNIAREDYARRFGLAQEQSKLAERALTSNIANQGERLNLERQSVDMFRENAKDQKRADMLSGITGVLSGLGKLWWMGGK